MADLLLQASKDRLLRLLDEIRDDCASSPSTVIRHAMRLFCGDPYQLGEESMKWCDLVAGSDEPVGRLRPLSWDRQTRWITLRRGMSHGFYGIVSHVAELYKFQELAAQVLDAATQYLLAKQIGYRLIIPDYLYDIISKYTASDYWILACYNLAWDHPGRLNYQVRGYSSPADPSKKIPGPPICPFNDRQSFEDWGIGNRMLPEGEHWLRLSRDVRYCTMEAIRAVLAMDEPMRKPRWDRGSGKLTYGEAVCCIFPFA